MWLPLYYFLISLAGLFFWPFWQYRSLKRAQGAWARLRLGFTSQHLDKLPSGGIWVHALSVGEVRTALSVVKALVRRYAHLPLYFSVATYGGYKMARDELAKDGVHILVRPLDVPWAVKRWITALKPCCFCLVESDMWPAWQRALKNAGVLSVLLNARISPRTFKKYVKCPGAARLLYRDFDLICVQSGLDKERLQAIGIPDAQALGNIKFDSLPRPLDEEERRELAHELGLSGRKVFIAGSTHPAARGNEAGEEEICLQVWQRLKERGFNDLVLVLAPRDVRRGEQVAAMTTDGWPVSRGALPAGHSLLVLDVIGKLARAYGLAEVAYVGGSLVAQGGHNPLEASIQGVAALYGPHMEDFAQMAAALNESGGGMTIFDENDLYEKCLYFLSHPDKARAHGRMAREFCISHQGALQRVMDVLPELEKNA